MPRAPCWQKTALGAGKLYSPLKESVDQRFKWTFGIAVISQYSILDSIVMVAPVSGIVQHYFELEVLLDVISCLEISTAFVLVLSGEQEMNPYILQHGLLFVWHRAGGQKCVIMRWRCQKVVKRTTNKISKISNLSASLADLYLWSCSFIYVKCVASFVTSF